MLKNVHVCSQSYLRHAVTSHVWAIVRDALVAFQNGDNYPPLAAMPEVELCFENAWSPITLHEEWKLEIPLYYVQILKPVIHRTWWIWSVCKCVSHSMGYPPLCYLLLLWLDSERGWQSGGALVAWVMCIYIFMYIYTCTCMCSFGDRICSNAHMYMHTCIYI